MSESGNPDTESGSIVLLLLLLLFCCCCCCCVFFFFFVCVCVCVCVCFIFRRLERRYIGQPQNASCTDLTSKEETHTTVFGGIFREIKAGCRRDEKLKIKEWF